ncbi:MAG: hypothetical protein ACI9CA_000025 [Natronomonas sp.]|jgi:hypothetical protein
MGFRCPVCGYHATSYPRSAGMREMHNHYGDEHPRRWKAVQTLRQRERQERSFLDRLLNGSDVPGIEEVDPDEVLGDDAGEPAATPG